MEVYWKTATFTRTREKACALSYGVRELTQSPTLSTMLLLHCAVTISDALHYARRLFLHFRNPDAFMYNTLIRGLAESDTPHNALVVFAEMRRRLTDPIDNFSFAFVLKAAANCGALRDGMQLRCQALACGLDTHLFVGTTLISMYAECGRVKFAQKVFEEMREPNVVVWNAILTSCFRFGDAKGAETMFGQMPLRNLTSWNILLAGYVKTDELELAKKAFLRMPMKDDVSGSTMIVGFAQNGCFDEAFGFFRELQREGIRPNEASC